MLLASSHAHLVHLITSAFFFNPGSHVVEEQRRRNTISDPLFVTARETLSSVQLLIVVGLSASSHEG